MSRTVYSRYENLNQKHISFHKQKVTGPFVCERGTCGKGYQHIRDKERHIRIHDNHLLHCHFCPWAGNTDLGNHLNHHFNIRPYNCSYCAKQFYTHKDKKYHEETYHERIADRYRCDLCLFKTHSSVILGYHKRDKKCIEG